MVNALSALPLRDRLGAALRCLLIIVLLAASQVACSAKSGCTGSACTRVLFIGNSYTFVNNLPDVFADLAASAGRRVDTGLVAAGGWTLARHAASGATAAK